MSRRVRLLLYASPAVAVLVAAALLIVACGGGGGTSAPPPPPPPPVVTTPPAATGCSVAVDEGPFTPVWPGVEWQTATPQSQGMCPDGLDDALDYAFRAGNDTGAVLVAKNGYVVAERYANDRSVDDLVTSWSVAKSVASALLGAALDDGYLHDLDEQHVQEFLSADDAEAWSETDKANITLRHMLTLRTAMRTVDGGDLYDAADQLAMSLDRPLIGEPGERLYDYSNGDVMIAGEVLYGATGMSAQHFLDGRIGALIDFQGDWWEDESGNVMSYCCLDALPRKFLRFGLLFARGGEWNGSRVVSEAWVAESTASALEGEYGFYWWPIAVGNGIGAFGLHSQIVAAYPQDDLVVARFSRYTRVGDGHPVRTATNYHGTSEPEDFDNAEFLAMVHGAIE